MSEPADNDPAPTGWPYDGPRIGGVKMDALVAAEIIETARAALRTRYMERSAPMELIAFAMASSLAVDAHPELRDEILFHAGPYKFVVGPKGVEPVENPNSPLVRWRAMLARVAASEPRWWQRREP